MSKGARTKYASPPIIFLRHQWALVLNWGIFGVPEGYLRVCVCWMIYPWNELDIFGCWDSLQLFIHSFFSCCFGTVVVAQKAPIQVKAYRVGRVAHSAREQSHG